MADAIMNRDIIYNLLVTVPIKDLGRLCQLNTTYAEICNSNLLWRYRIEYHFGPSYVDFCLQYEEESKDDELFEENITTYNQNWKYYYIDLLLIVDNLDKCYDNLIILNDPDFVTDQSDKDYYLNIVSNTYFKNKEKNSTVAEKIKKYVQSKDKRNLYHIIYSEFQCCVFANHPTTHLLITLDNDTKETFKQLWLNYLTIEEGRFFLLFLNRKYLNTTFFQNIKVQHVSYIQNLIKLSQETLLKTNISIMIPILFIRLLTSDTYLSSSVTMGFAYTALTQIAYSVYQTIKGYFLNY